MSPRRKREIPLPVPDKQPTNCSSNFRCPSFIGLLASSPHCMSNSRSITTLPKERFFCRRPTPTPSLGWLDPFAEIVAATSSPEKKKRIQMAEYWSQLGAVSETSHPSLGRAQPRSAADGFSFRVSSPCYCMLTPFLFRHVKLRRTRKGFDDLTLHQSPAQPIPERSTEVW